MSVPGVWIPVYQSSYSAPVFAIHLRGGSTGIEFRWENECPTYVACQVKCKTSPVRNQSTILSLIECPACSFVDADRVWPFEVSNGVIGTQQSPNAGRDHRRTTVELVDPSSRFPERNGQRSVNTEQFGAHLRMSLHDSLFTASQSKYRLDSCQCSCFLRIRVRLCLCRWQRQQDRLLQRCFFSFIFFAYRHVSFYDMALSTKEKETRPRRVVSCPSFPNGEGILIGFRRIRKGASVRPCN